MQDHMRFPPNAVLLIQQRWEQGQELRRRYPLSSDECNAADVINYMGLMCVLPDCFIQLADSAMRQQVQSHPIGSHQSVSSIPLLAE